MSYCTSIKVSVAVTQTSNFIVDTMALPGNPVDRYTLYQALDQVHTLTGASVEEAYVDRGYRGHSETQTRVCPLEQRRGVNPQFKHYIKRRKAVEPLIGNIKSDSLPRRHYLKGQQGDAMNAVLVHAGHNLQAPYYLADTSINVLAITEPSPNCNSSDNGLASFQWWARSKRIRTFSQLEFHIGISDAHRTSKITRTEFKTNFTDR